METGAENDFVLRLVTVKIEGVLVPDFDSIFSNEFQLGTSTVDVDELFPAWIKQVQESEAELRSGLKQLPNSNELLVDDDIVQFIDWLCNHTPIRVAILSSGPGEWVQSLLEAYNLNDYIDLAYHYDRYPHGSRRTLLQFLMNRFIAGRERTMFLGETDQDQRLAEHEQTRFRSLETPQGSLERADKWGYNLNELREEIKTMMPEP